MAPKPSSLAIPEGIVASHIGGHIALDFCNTAGWHLSETPSERFRDWERFVRWLVQVELVEASDYAALAAQDLPVSEIIALREAIFRIGCAAARKEMAASADLALLQALAGGEAPPLKAREARFYWEPEPGKASHQLRTVLARQALGLFCSPEASRIGLCEGGTCGWLFIDSSRNKRRRWCSMDDCGSRAKAKRFYASHSGKSGPG